MSLYDVNGNIVSTDTKYYSAEDKKQPLSYYGIDIDNNVRIDVKVPDGANRLPKNNLTMIGQVDYPGYSSPITVKGDTSKIYYASWSQIYVNDVVYTLHRWDFTDLPSNPKSWFITLAVTSSYYSNDKTWFVQDMPLEEITAEFIASECTESVSVDFLKSVKIARKNEAKATDILSLKGKIWLALGDSYTHFLGASYTDGVTPSTTGKWGILASELGMTLYGYGISSSTVITSNNGTNQAYSFKPMSSRVDTLISDHQHEAENVGLITFMGGANDSWAETFLGDLKSLESNTFYGACHQILNKLVNAFPKAKIVVILQPSFGNSEPPSDSEFNGMSSGQYCTYAQQLKQRIVKEVAEFYGVTICDCCFEWYTPMNPVHFPTIWSEDKIHLSTLGNQKLTEKLISTLDKTFV